MHIEFTSLAIIAVTSAIIPMIAKSIPKKIIPETVLLLVAGAALGPYGAGIIDSNSESIHLLS